MSTQPAFDLSGRCALVTGGNSGIGLSLAEALGRAGARVLLVARRAEQLDAAAQSLRALGIAAEALAADLADLGGLAGVAEQARKWATSTFWSTPQGSTCASPLPRSRPRAGSCNSTCTLARRSF